MLVIRLIRTGKKNASSFRVVLTEKRNAPKSGKFLEVLGSYNPRLKHKNKKEAVVLKKDRIKFWLSCGAKFSDTVHNLLVSQGVIKGPKIAKKIKPSKSKGAANDEQLADEKKPAKELGEEKQKLEKKAKVEKSAANIQPKEKPADDNKGDKKERVVDKPKEKE